MTGRKITNESEPGEHVVGSQRRRFEGIPSWGLERGVVVKGTKQGGVDVRRYQ